MRYRKRQYNSLIVKYNQWFATNHSSREVYERQIRDHSLLIGLSADQIEKRVKQGLKEFDHLHGSKAGIR